VQVHAVLAEDELWTSSCKCAKTARYGNCILTYLHDFHTERMTCCRMQCYWTRKLWNGDCYTLPIFSIWCL